MDRALEPAAAAAADVTAAGGILEEPRGYDELIRLPQSRFSCWVSSYSSVHRQQELW